jgi:hypothetical protein
MIDDSQDELVNGGVVGKGTGIGGGGAFTTGCACCLAFEAASGVGAPPAVALTFNVPEAPDGNVYLIVCVPD